MNRGYTLVEALVALTLLACGLLVAAAAVLQAVRHERDAATRTIALRLVASLAEDLRALARPDGRPLLAPTGIAPDIACADHPPSCAREATAAARRAEFAARATLLLPSGVTTQVALPDLSRRSYRVELRWPGSDGGEVLLRLGVDT